MVVQILDAEPDSLAWTRTSNRQRVGQQPELIIDPVGSSDELPHRVIGENDVAGLLRIRQTGQSDFPSVAVLNPFVMLRCLLQRGTHASNKPVDGRRGHRAQQAVAPFLQLGGCQQRQGLRQQQRW